VAELWDEYLVKGSEVSGYYFIVLVDEGTVLGFACYGPRASPAEPTTFIGLPWISARSTREPAGN